MTDRAAVVSRGRGPVRELSNVGGGGVSELRRSLREVEVLKGSASFSQREVEEILNSTKAVGDAGVDWTKRINMVSLPLSDL